MSNRLAQETSPYLLQHADNPVDWHAWGPEALELARAEDKPILLSIGYSACHWCHVMAHESFEDPETAELMNRLFVNVKVDREERPDLDRIYQTAQQLYSGRPGGWPLTAFLTPQAHVPIFVGTYFPKEPRYGMPSFRDVLTRVEAYYRTHPDEIRGNGRALIEAFRQLDAPAEDARLSREPLAEARRRLGEVFDNRHGGFGEAPKFPRASSLALLLDAWATSRAAGAPDAGAFEMVTRSLTEMAGRGLYDHLGGGFYRYSVDRRWSIPHFEKMLYDNAALLALYADAYAATGEADYARVAAETADWALREMRAEDGGFYSTLDADSEGREGKFYVWSRDEVDRLLEPGQRDVAVRFYGLDGPPNFEDEWWHLQNAASIEQVAEDLGVEPARAAERLEAARRRLFEARRRRVPPGRDEKRLAAWNGLMIRALARASRRLARPDLAEAAAAAADFVRTRLWDGRRLATAYKEGRARVDAYLDDYAFVGAGLVELMQCRFRACDLEFARGLAEALLAHFEDERGGFYFTSDEHERLLHRPKPLADEAVPSGNGVAAELLSDLGHLLGERRYLEAAERTVGAAFAALERYPEGHAALLRALERRLEPPELVVVRAPAAELDAWREAVESGYSPRRLAFLIPHEAQALPGLLAERRAREVPVAYVCRGLECGAPLEDPAALRETLDR